MKILVQALSDWGVGAKTRSGYGRFLKPEDLVLPSTADDKLNKFKLEIDANKSTLASRVAVFWDKIEKETDMGLKIAMARIVKEAFGDNQLKKSCKRGKVWALGIAKLLGE